MASIRSLGVGSGLDLDNLVQQLLAAERQPVEQRLVRNEARAQSQLSALGSISGSLSALRDQVNAMLQPGALAPRTAVSQDPEVFTANATAQARSGSFEIEVVSLASSERTGSQAFSSADTEIGIGSLEVSLGDQAFSVEIDSSANRLSDIRDAINAAVDNPGITATILNEDSGSRLILTSDESGAANTILVSASGGDGGLESLESQTQLRAASDAVIRLDTFTISSSNNRIGGAVEGLTIDLVEARPGETFSLTVTGDRDQTGDQLQRLVDRINGVRSSISRVTAFNPETGDAAPLLGDSAVRILDSSISQIISRQGIGPGAGFDSLPALGVRTNDDGSLEIDQTRLNQVLDQDPRAVEQALSGEQGVLQSLLGFLDSAVADDGLISLRQDGLRSRLDGIDQQRRDLDRRMERVEQRFVSQFSALDSLVARLTQTSDFLQQQLQDLPGPATRRSR